MTTTDTNSPTPKQGEIEHLEGNSDTHDLKFMRDQAHHAFPIHLACDCGYTIEVSYRKWSWILQRKLEAVTAQVQAAEARGRRDELERLRQQVYVIMGREPAAAPAERYVKLRLAALQDTTGEGKK